MKKYYCLLILCFCISTFALAQHNHSAISTDKPSVHGMLIFGTDKIYASHLAMFHAPHNYQIIIEVVLEKVAKQKFVADQKAHPEFTTYTIEPEKFVLPDMISKQGSFKANLYRGHFERGGVKIADSILVKIVSIVYFKNFDITESKLSTSNFIVFGGSKEQFAAHQISHQPDFEQILQVKTTLEKNKKEIINCATSNHPIGISGNTITVKISNKDSDITLLKQLYLEFDDLKE
jgi:hypothetical protein